MFNSGNVVKIWGLFLILGIIVATLQIYLTTLQIKNHKLLEEIKDLEKQQK